MSIKSEFIFKLAEKHALLNSIEKIDDDQIKLFSSDYKTLADTRDVNLHSYLQNNSSLFRTYIPYGKNFLDQVIEVVWYYDELIVADPFSRIIYSINNSRDINFAELKESLISCLHYLYQIRACIDEGYILFDSSYLDTQFNNQDIIDDETLKPFFLDQQLKEEFYKLVDIWFQKQNGQLSAVMVQHQDLRNMRFFPFKDSSGKTNAYIDFIGQFEKGTLNDIKRLDLMSLLEGEISDGCSIEVSQTLKTIKIGQRNNSNILFNRRFDVLALDKLNEYNPSPKKDHSKKVFEASLPFLNNIDPRRLIDLRLKMPMIFNEFRGHLLRITINASKEHANDGELVNYKLHKEINSLLLKFDVEQKNAARNARILGIVPPTASAIAYFAINSLGLEFSQYLTLITGGVNVVNTATQFAKYLDTKENAKANPIYFLWKANQD